MKQQQQKLAAQAEQLGELAREVAELKSLVAALTPRATDERVAMR